MRTAVGEEAVGDSDGGAIGNGVAVSLVLVLVVEGFSVGEGDARALAG